MNKNNFSKDFLEERFDEHVKKAFVDFSFRPHQKNTILDILEVFFNSSSNLYILDAPTGSGKSIIAIILSSFLADQYFKGYILTSDLSLQKQYEDSFNEYKLDWGSIKGVDNYWCSVNSTRFSLGECRIKNLSYDKAEKLPCFPTCEYLQARKKAINSPVSLLNYSYWLISRNYVAPRMKEQKKQVPFKKRDFTICDEGHKITDIVQNHFSPIISERSLKNFKGLQKSLKILGEKSNFDFNTLVKNIVKETNSDNIYALLKDFETNLLSLKRNSEAIRSYVDNNFKDDIIPQTWRYNLSLMDWCKDIHCKIEDYNKIISKTSTKNIIKNPIKGGIVLNCLDESFMMDKYFHDKSKFKLIMSATIGNPKIFLTNINRTDGKYLKMDNSFNFKKSPIYFYTKKKMSARKKTKNFPWLIEKIEEILDEHSDERGIIHTGSYNLSFEICDAISKKFKRRLVIYKDSSEKEDMLNRFFNEENSILIGPSIIEGIDLPNDKSRFQIFAKVPYPSLSDKLVKAKSESIPGWYNWKTSISVIQGTGRSIRNDNDWAVTYFLDACLSNLFRNSINNFPEEFLQRIIFLK